MFLILKIILRCPLYIIDINILLNEIYNSFEILLKNNKIKLEYKQKDNEVLIMGDFNRLKQVMLNIIKNSIEAIEDNGIIKMNSYIKNKSVIIEIIDNGKGMTEEELNKVTDLFFTTKKNGTGVGVTLSKEIVNAHDGIIEYSSKINKGTKVKIKLPLFNNK